MSIWFKKFTIAELNKGSLNSMVEHCGIELTNIGEDYLEGTMPADRRTTQPFGIVHGGANCVLAETLGSIAANMTCDGNEKHCVGLSITTNHIKAVRNGSVRGIAKPTHIGKSTQLWEIETFNDANQITSKTSLSMAVIKKLN